MDDPLPQWLLPQWTKYLSEQHTAVEDIFDDLFACDLAPLQRKRELSRMIGAIRGHYGAVQRPVRSIMEIGVDKGGTFYHWLRAFPTIKYAVGVEIRGTPESDLFAAAFPHVKFLWIDQSSYDPKVVRDIHVWLRSYDAPLDFLFIDGDKHKFYADYANFLPVMREKSVIAMHDVKDDAPMRSAFIEAAKRHEHKEVIIDTSEVDDYEANRLINVITSQTAAPDAHNAFLDAWGHTSCGFGIIYT